jgi:hypothetical protein
MKANAKTGICWFAAILGVFIGLYFLAEFGMSAPDVDSWLSFVGVGLVGFGFLAGSIAALRRPKVGGIIFLAVLPVAAFCLAYPQAGYVVWHQDGSGWFETPSPTKAIGLAAVFFAPFAAPLFLPHNKKRAMIAFAGGSFAATLVFIRSHWTSALIPRLAGYSVPFLLFGLFWLGTYKIGWPSLYRPRHLKPVRRTLGIVYICAAILVIDVVFTFGLCALFSSLWSADCNGAPPVTSSVHRRSPESAVFTVRAVFVGRSVDALLNPWIRSSHIGEWAIGEVQERFWGLPSWLPRFVLMTNFIYQQGQTYLIDGAQTHGLLTRFLPIVGAGINCTRSGPVGEAIVDLRLLHEPAADSTRLIGYVKEPGPFIPLGAPPIQPTFDSGAKITVTGKNATRTVTTDQTGIYQLDDLPPGDYTLKLDVPPNEQAGDFGDESTVKVHLERGSLVDYDFNLVWNGRISGQVNDDSGKAGHARIELQNSDGSRLPGYVRDSLQTNPDGSYEINRVPPGGYFVIANPDGPSDQSPYNIQYYPGASGTQNAQAVELGQGQEVRDVNFTVTPLMKRTIRVRVAWQSGKPAKDAWVYVAYARTKAFQSLANAADFRRTDDGGNVELDVFGDSPIRVFAETAIDDGTIRSRFSPPVELDATNLPTSLTLILSASTLQ